MKKGKGVVLRFYLKVIGFQNAFLHFLIKLNILEAVEHRFSVFYAFS